MFAVGVVVALGMAEQTLTREGWTLEAAEVSEVMVAQGDGTENQDVREVY